jgi:hypothetical protein
MTTNTLPAGVVAAASALFAVALVSPAKAATVISPYSDLFQGVSTSVVTLDSGDSGTFVKVDLAAPGVQVITTPKCSGCTPNTSATWSAATSEVDSQTTSAFLVSQGAQVAINANRDARNSGGTLANELGLAVSNGSLVSLPETLNDALLIKAGNAASIVDGNATGVSALNLNGVVNAVSGTTDMILKDGAVTTTDTSSAFRSGLALSADGQYLFLLHTSASASLVEMAAMFYAIGADDALNLNGGQGSSLVVDDGSGGATRLGAYSAAERSVASNLGIKAAPLAPVPLPGAVWLLGSGLAGVFAARRRRASFARGGIPS